MARESSIPVVVFACTLTLFVPFLNSIGASLNSLVTEGVSFTNLSVFIGVAWIASIFIGAIREHEHGVACFVDSAGFPGLITALILSKNAIGI
jgi:hypothetical protein